MKKKFKDLVLGIIEVCVSILDLVISAFSSRFVTNCFLLFIVFCMCCFLFVSSKDKIKTDLEKGLWVETYASTFGKNDGLMGKPMYSGRKVDDKTLFFASRMLPMGTKILIYYPKTKKQVVSTCMDWGPAEWTKKDIDLGPRVSRELGFVGRGYVKIRVLK